MNGVEENAETARSPMLDAEGRAVRAVLTESGHYQETTEDFQWATIDAESVLTWLNERGRTYRNAWDALVDTGLHDPDDQLQAACLAADVEAIRVVLSTPIDGTEATQ